MKMVYIAYALSHCLNMYAQLFSIAIGLNEPQLAIFNNVVCATSKASDQPGHTNIL